MVPRRQLSTFSSKALQNGMLRNASGLPLPALTLPVWEEVRTQSSGIHTVKQFLSSHSCFIIYSAWVSLDERDSFSSGRIVQNKI